jgi:hypothetical protein
MWPVAPPIRRRIDENPIATVLANEQLEVVGAERPLLKERKAAGTLDPGRYNRIGRKLADPLQQTVAVWQSIQHRASVSVLSLEKGKPRRILVVFHPAIGIAERLTEVSVARDLDARHRWRRHGGVSHRGRQAFRSEQRGKRGRASG